MTKIKFDAKNEYGLNFWETAWKNTGGIESFSPHSRFIEEVKWDYLRKDLKDYSGYALEVGCGSGHVGSLLAQSGFQALLVDYSPSGIACAQKSFTTFGGRERKTYLMGNAFTLPFKSESVDVVTSTGLIEHFENPEAVIMEMVRVLRRGGLFYADIVPRKFSLIRSFEKLQRVSEGWYESNIGKKEINYLLTNAGLEKIKLFAAGVLPPRSIPGIGRFKFLAKIEVFLIQRFKKFWTSLDGTQIANIIGMYYYITARKPNV